MHFTLWPSLTSSEGGHAEITWESFLQFVANPVVAADKKSLQGWSPARFKGNRRARANAEAVSCIVLDDDKSGLAPGALAVIWREFSGVFHSSFSSTTAAPKWRIVLRTSRDMTSDEHACVWRWVRDYAAKNGQTIDEATKDPSRLWFVPAHPPTEHPVAYRLDGAPLDVDTILATSQTPSDGEKRSAGHAAAQPDASPLPGPGRGGLGRRQAMAAALGASWPAKGRHEAQLALAGALRAEGWAEAEAVDFLCAVCRAAGDENRPKREATCRHTWGKPEGSALTGWTRLKAFVDPVVVDATRGALGKTAEWSERVQQRLAEVATAQVADRRQSETSPIGDLEIKWGGWNEPVVVPPYLLHGLIPAGSVCTFFAEGGSVKTWAAFALAMSVATGRKWLGEYVVKPGRALLLDWEDGREEFKRRRQILLPGQDDFPLLGYKWGQLDMLSPDTWIALAELRLELVVVDSLGTAMPGDADENATEFAAAVKHAGKLAETMKTTVLFVHHANKSGGMRGTSAIRDQSDCAFKFEPVSEENSIKRMRLVCDKPGPQKKPAPVNIELSDRGLCTFKEEPADTGSPDSVMRQRILELLVQHTAGIPKSRLFDLLKGKHEIKRSALAKLTQDGVVSEQTDSGRYGKVFVFLTRGQ